jgi:transposase-like protein
MVTIPDKENIITRQDDYTLQQDMAELGLVVNLELLCVLINQAIQAERLTHINERQNDQTNEHKGHANGYKSKLIRIGVGEITFAVPQVREGGFYPSALKKSLRSERVLLIALVEMYVQGVSTRKVKVITEELCGVDVSAM